MLIVGTEDDDVLSGYYDGDTIFGDGGDDTIYGFDGADFLDGGEGNDTLYGGWLDDTLYGGAGDDTLDGGFGPDTLRGDGGNDTLYGEGDDDYLNGGAGNDTLDGGIGADDMYGGTGNDIYYVDNAADFIFEWGGEGVDTVIASISYSLPADVENLTLAPGTAPLNGTGNSLHNNITGNAGANMLAGRDGNDTLDGGAGGDDMSGGRHNDTYIVDNSGDTVTELAGEGTDRVFSSINYTLSANVEDLYLTGGLPLNGSGNSLRNTITGNDNANTLNGRGDADTMIGRGGADTYFVDHAGDVVVERAGEGTDTVRASFSYTLGAEIENLQLGASAADGTGNRLDNTIIGNGLGNRLSGDAGQDVLIGWGGSDTLSGGDGADQFKFLAPTDGGPKGDAITDFDVQDDLIALENGGFGLVGTGSLASQGVDFVVGQAATTGDPTVIVSPFTKEVWWDADGTGAGGAQLLAKVTLPAFATLAESDFVIV